MSPDCLLTFRAEYGRLCTLVAQALHRGHNHREVIEASCGRGQGVAPVYVNLRKQRAQVNAAISACKVFGVPNLELINLARDTRVAVEQEWQRRIPTLA